MDAIAWFMCIFVLIWTFGCIGLVLQALNAPSEDNTLRLMAPLFILADIGAACFLASRLWGSTRITLLQHQIVIERQLFSSKMSRSCERSKVRAIRQKKDGGDTQDDGYGNVSTNHDDSFPTWGLFFEVEGDKDFVVLSRQSIEQGDWLGPLLAEWYEKPYTPSPIQPRSALDP